jgi:hypothetical protein
MPDGKLSRKLIQRRSGDSLELLPQLGGLHLIAQLKSRIDQTRPDLEIRK